MPYRAKVKEHYPEAKYHYTSQIAVADGEGDRMPTITEHTNKLDLVRMWSEDRKRILQLADDRLAVNTLRAGSEYEGFGKLRSEAFDRLTNYVEVYEPVSIETITIHLTDIIEVPFTDPAPEIEQLFKIARNLSTDPFGDTSDLMIQYSTTSPHDGQPLQIQLGRVPSGQPGTLRFRMDWEKSSRVDCRPDDRSRLDDALTTDYQFLVKCFESSLTEPTLALFSPFEPPVKTPDQ